MKAVHLLLSVILLFHAPIAAQELKTVTILGTADLHGEIMPFRYLSNKPSEQGLALISTMVGKIRSENPATLLLDAGDALQGNPLVFLNSRSGAGSPNPMVTAMNGAGYDAFVVGNHEFNYGPGYLEKARREARFPFLGGNILDASGPHYLPWIIKDLDGIKVGVVGLTVPAIPKWEDPENREGLDFGNPLEAARKYVPEVRARGADLVILACHFGLTADPVTGVGRADYEAEGNLGETIARDVPGIDGILLAHNHELVATSVNGIPLLEPKALGTHLARFDFLVGREVKDTGSWTVKSRQGSLIEVTAGGEPDPRIIDSIAEDHQKTLAYLDGIVGTASRALETGRAAFEDNPLSDLILDAMIEETGADISFTGLPPEAVRISTGTIRIRDIFNLYAFDNRLRLVDLSGNAIREILEHSCGYYLEPGGRKTLRELINPGFRFYDCDLAQGISYDVDLSKPLGKRITKLWIRGVPVNPLASYTVAVSNFRLNGGGDYAAYRNATRKPCPERNIRDMVIDSVKRRGRIPEKPDSNWRLLPEALQTLPLR